MPGHADPREALIRQALNLQRAVNAISVDRNGTLRAMFDEIVAQIQRIDPTAVTASVYRRARIAKLLDTIEDLAGDAYADWYRGVRSDMSRIGRVEALQTRADLVASLGAAGIAVSTQAPTQAMLKAIIDTDPFRGETLKGWVKNVNEPATVRRVRQQIQIGMTGEEDVQSMVRRIRGRSNGRGGYLGGVMETTTREATALVRTAVTDIAGKARIETFRQNPRVVTGWVWVSALDTRTCEICGGLDGKIFPLSTTWEPAHWSCRCTSVSEIDWDRLGLEPPEPGMRAARDAEGELAGKPRSQTRTEVPADTTYEQWLRGQKAGVQDEILGPGRGKLFRDRKVRLDQLVGSDKRLVTIKELERRVGA